MSRLQANLLLGLAALLWGSSFVVQQVGTGDLGTMSFTGARFLLGGLIVLPFALRQYKKVQQSERPMTQKDFLTLGGIGLVLYTGASLQQYGILHTSVTNSGFLTALYVPMVPLIGLLVLRRIPHWSVWPASVGCFVGTYIMSGAHSVELATGDWWVIASTIFWASHVILVGSLASRTGAPLVVACGQFLVCGIFGLVVGTIVESSTLAHYMGAIYGILYIGVFSVAIAFTLQVVGQRYTPAPDAAIILSSETVFAAIGGAVFLGERLSGFQLFGASLIFMGILAVELLPMLKWAKPLK